MNQYEKSLITVRDRIMKERKIICTGNPSNPKNIAHGIKQIFPDTTFVHKSMGVDLEKDTDVFTDLLENHNTFINASYIGHNTQTNLLKIAAQTFKMGQVFNIGSTNEYDSLGEKSYCESKNILKKTSLELNNFRVQTTHIILGGIDIGNQDTKNWIKPIEIAQLIQWITQQKHAIPLIALDQNKKPW